MIVDQLFTDIPTELVVLFMNTVMFVFTVPKLGLITVGEVNTSSTDATPEVVDSSCILTPGDVPHGSSVKMAESRKFPSAPRPAT